MRRKILLFIAGCLLISGQIYSQVGINTENPHPLAWLEVANLTGTDGKVIPKGIMIPSLTEAQRNEMDMSGTNAPISLMIYNTDEGCYNYYSKLEKEWQSVCGKMGKAKLKILCGDVEPVGIYVEGQDLNASNYLKITVEVEKAGSYEISGTTTNGYFFTASGTFFDVGTFVIYATGHGKPEDVQADVVSLINYGTDTECTVTVNVVSSVAVYSLNCSSIVVNGNYLKDNALTAANTINLTLNVSALGSYSITTPVTSGISFSASGTFTSTGTQNITLVGTGKPTVNDDFPITINTNTKEGNATCTTTIPMTLPPLTYALIGNSQTYSWAGEKERRTALKSGSSFGLNGTVKIVSLKLLWETNSAATAKTRLDSGFTGTTESISYVNAQPDIILYFAYDAANSEELSIALANYVNKGGVLIYAANSTLGFSPGGTNGTGLTHVRLLMNGIFGPTSTANNAVRWQSRCQSNSAEGFICPDRYVIYDAAYKINELPNDPVVNGPFGNLGGKYWAEDNETDGTTILTNLPPNSVQICSAYNDYAHRAVDPAYSTVWYNDSKNFFYFGDTNGAPTYDNSGEVNDKGGYPAYYNASGIPTAKQYGNGNNSASPYVYVAHLELNALAWAIRKAAISGINPH